MSRRLRLSIARLMLAVLAFAQGTLGFATCDWVARAPAQVFTAAEQPSCHEPATPRNANLCLAHCLSGDQFTITPPVVVLPAMPDPLVVLPASPAPPHASWRADLLPPKPPPSFLFLAIRQ